MKYRYIEIRGTGTVDFVSIDLRHTVLFYPYLVSGPTLRVDTLTLYKRNTESKE